MSDSHYIPRLIAESIQKFPRDKALALFGARQIGKSTLLNTLFSGARTRLLTGDEFDDVALLTNLKSKSDLQVLLAGLDVLIIDEAQRIPSVGLLLKRIVDARTDCRIIATGSSSLELAGGVMESGAGRLVQERLWPISIQELAKENSWLDVVQDLPARLVFGCYPYVICRPDMAKQTLSDLFESVAFKDIFSLARVRKPAKFVHLVKLLAYNIGRLVSYERLARGCGLTANSVESYITLLEQSFIVKTLTCYSRNLANELKKSKKIYFCDLGIRNAALNNFIPFSARDDAERGALWENFFVMERIKHHDYARTETYLFFWRDKQQNEVDIVEVSENGTMSAIECKVKEESVSPPQSFVKNIPNADTALQRWGIVSDSLQTKTDAFGCVSKT